MSRPFRFEDGRPQSPFDRPPQNPQTGPPPSFKTNVNRNKTKKWAEAKSYNYDGDDWGGYDPYDEYGSNEEPPSQSTAQSAHPPRPAQGGSLRQRQNSFERGEERRAFSAGVPPPPVDQEYDYPPPQPSYASNSSGRSSSPGGRSSNEFGTRRDFSQPAQVPPPLQTRMSPSPAASPSSGRPPIGYVPPRKSSASQSQPLADYAREQPQASAIEPAAAEITSKPLPFIRPSDIYKRMEEEKERERNSMDSSRASMDSARSRPNPDTLAARDRSPERKSLDSTQRSMGLGRRPSLDPVSEDSEVQRPVGSNLSPLPERTNEQEFQGFTVANPVLARAIGADVAPSASETPATPLQHDQFSHLDGYETSPERVSPSKNGLPPVNRVASGFGSDFWGSSQLPYELQQDPSSSMSTGLTQHSEEPEREMNDPKQTSRQPDLQHQPSLGFQSVVHQAFDRQDDNSVPPTPISQSNPQSLSTSDVSRSNTDSTSGISPIMSRVPSAATAETRTRNTETRDTTIPPIEEEIVSPASAIVTSAPQSADDTRTLTPGHSRNVSSEVQPSTFRPGYRRGMDSPSPSSSPARSPEIETGKRLSQPMQAEMAGVDETTNVEAAEPTKAPQGLGLSSIVTTQSINRQSDYATREADLAETAASSPEVVSPGFAKAAQDARTDFLSSHSPSTSTTNAAQTTKSIPRATTPITGRQSPAPGRVRDLAGKFNEIDDTSRRNSQTSLKSKSSFSSWGRSDDALSLKRTRTIGSPLESPVNEQTEFASQENTYNDGLSMRPTMSPARSFRPRLPGEWISYAQNPESTLGVAQEREPEHNPGLEAPHDATEQRAQTPETPTAQKIVDEEVDLTPTTKKQPLRGKSLEIKDANPVTLVKDAGAALGAALLASMGSQHKSTDFANPEASTNEVSSNDEEAPKRSIGDVYLRPLQLDRTASSVASSAPPTPPPKDEPLTTQPEKSSDYFPRSAESELPTPTSATDEREDMESDRLRREIVRSLSPNVQQEEYDEDRTREQDALDAPHNLASLKHEDQQIHELPAPVPTFAVNRAREQSSDSRPGLIDQRFSWEDRKPGYFNEPATQAGSDVTRGRPQSGLHVINTDIEADSKTTHNDTRSPVEGNVPNEMTPSSAYSTGLDAPTLVHNSVSPIETPDIAVTHADRRLSQDDETPPSPVPTSPISDQFKPLPTSPGGYTTPRAGSIAVEASAPSPTIGQVRIPPFREILAIRSAPDRINTYNTTRQQFLEMNTGLRDWLSGTIAANSEHEHLITDAPSKPSNLPMGSIRHRQLPSVIKMAKGLGSSNRGDTQTTSGGDQEGSFSAGRRPSETLRSSSQQGGGVGAKSKDLLHTAGVLGGKGMVGAKGWLAKGKKKLRESGAGTDKVD